MAAKFADDIFKGIFLNENENDWFSIKFLKVCS